MLRRLIAMLIFAFALTPLAATAGVYIFTLTPQVTVPPNFLSFIPGNTLYARCYVNAGAQNSKQTVVPLQLTDGKYSGPPTVTLTVDSRATDATFKPNVWICDLAVKSPDYYEPVLMWLNKPQGKAAASAGGWQAIDYLTALKKAGNSGPLK